MRTIWRWSGCALEMKHHSVILDHKCCTLNDMWCKTWEMLLMKDSGCSMSQDYLVKLLFPRLRLDYRMDSSNKVFWVLLAVGMITIKSQSEISSGTGWNCDIMCVLSWWTKINILTTENKTTSSKPLKAVPYKLAGPNRKTGSTGITSSDNYQWNKTYWMLYYRQWKVWKVAIVKNILNDEGAM